MPDQTGTAPSTSAPTTRASPVPAPAVVAPRIPTHLPAGWGHIAGLIRTAIPPMHPGGRPIVAGVAAVAGITRLLTGRGSAVGTLATLATAAFFREPRRVPPPRAGVVLAAADGTVALVGDAIPPPELGLPATAAPRVSVFLSVLDVHVQRIPVHGRILDVRYRPGSFLSADLDKASEDNEHNGVLLESTERQRIGIVQIAGLLARRIVCDVAAGDEVVAGETFGLIRFGSRVDVHLPPGSVIEVAVGQRTIGGETVLATLPPGVPGTVSSGVPGTVSSGVPGTVSSGVPGTVS